jgi:hypothetical protein
MCMDGHGRGKGGQEKGMGGQGWGKGGQEKGKVGHGRGKGGQEKSNGGQVMVMGEARVGRDWAKEGRGRVKRRERGTDGRGEAAIGGLRG